MSFWAWTSSLKQEKPARGEWLLSCLLVEYEHEDVDPRIPEADRLDFDEQLCGLSSIGGWSLFMVIYIYIYIYILSKILLSSLLLSIVTLDA